MPSTAPISDFKIVSDLLDRFRPVGAAQAAKGIYAAHPEDWNALKTAAQCQAILGKHARAEGMLDHAVQLFPDAADVYFERSRLYLQQRKLSLSEQQLRLARSYGLNEKRFFIQGANISGAKDDPFTELNYLKATAELLDYKEPVSIFKYAIKSMGYNNFETGIRLSSVLQSVDSSHIKSIELKCWVLALQRKYSELVDFLEQHLDGGTHTENLAILMNQLWVDLHYQPLLDLLKRTIQALPNSPTARLLGFRRQCISPATNADEVFKRDDKQQAPDTISREVIEMATLGNLDEARRIIHRFSERWPKGYNVNWDEETPMVLKAPEDSDLKRKVISATADQDWIASPEGSSGKLIIVFTALNGSGFCPLELLDRYFAADGHQVLYLRDYSGCFFLKGVKSLNYDVDAFKRAIRSYLDQHSHLSPIFAGLSAGSFAAVRFGIEAGVKHMIQFAPLSLLGAENSKFLADNRGIAIKQRTDEDLQNANLSLFDDLASAPNDTRIDLLYSPNVTYDVAHFRTLEPFDCTYPTMFEDCLRHNTLAPVLANGLLDRLLNQKMGNSSAVVS